MLGPASGKIKMFARNFYRLRRGNFWLTWLIKFVSTKSFYFNINIFMIENHNRFFFPNKHQ